MANKKYKLSDGNSWATDGIFDFGQNKTQRQINSDLNGAISDTRALFGDLSFKMFSMSGGKTATLTFSSKSNHAFIFTSGAYVAARSIMVVATSSTGVAADPTVLVGGEGVTMAKNANTVSITNGTGAMMVCGYMLLAGDIPTITNN